MPSGGANTPATTGPHVRYHGQFASIEGELATRDLYLAMTNN